MGMSAVFDDTELCDWLYLPPEHNGALTLAAQAAEAEAVRLTGWTPAQLGADGQAVGLVLRLAAHHYENRGDQAVEPAKDIRRALCLLYYERPA